MIVTFASITTRFAILVSLGVAVSSVFQGQSTTDATLGTATATTADTSGQYTSPPVLIEDRAAVQGGSTQSSLPLTPRPEGQRQSDSGQPPGDQRVFGVLPNYRTAEGSAPFQPITTKQKFIIASKDSFDYPVFLTTAFFAGLSQLQGSDSNSYSQGVKGFAHRYGIGYADQVTSNFFPEAIIPALFHMDPRYFRKGEGSTKTRLVYTVSHIFVSKSDSGITTFNSPEILGNALASLTDMSYHTHRRTAGDALTQWGTYVEADMVGQILREFWPDIKRKLFK